MYRISWIYQNNPYTEEFKALINAVNFYTYKYKQDENTKVQLQKLINDEWFIV